MPVAILRAQAKDLPLEFTLDDRSSMISGMKLSEQKQVVVARDLEKRTQHAARRRPGLQPTAAGRARNANSLSDVARSERKGG